MALLAGVLVLTVGLLALFYSGQLVLRLPLPAKYLGRLFIGGIPAVLAYFARCIALSGLWPRLRHLFWLYMGAGLIVTVFRGLFDLPQHAADFTPFGWIADVPRLTLATPWLPVMHFSAINCVILGMAGYRRQDLSV